MSSAELAPAALDAVAAVEGAPALAMAEPPPPPPFTARLEGAARSTLYVLISVPLGMLYHLTVGVGLMLGIALVPVLVGLPLLLAALLGAWSAARLERLVANRLLAARIPPLPRRTRAQAPLLRRLRDEATRAARGPWRRAGGGRGARLARTVILRRLLAVARVGPRRLLDVHCADVMRA